MCYSTVIKWARMPFNLNKYIPQWNNWFCKTMHDISKNCYVCCVCYPGAAIYLLPHVFGIILYVDYTLPLIKVSFLSGNLEATTLSFYKF